MLRQRGCPVFVLVYERGFSDVICILSRVLSEHWLELLRLFLG